MAVSQSSGPPPLAHQPPRAAFTKGPALPRSMVAACFARSTAMTLPISLMPVAPDLGDGLADRRLGRGRIHLLRQEALDHRDLRLLLRRQLLPAALAVELDALAAGLGHAAQHGDDLLLRHRVTPEGRAAMSVSFSLAVIIRRVEVVAASRASMAALSAAVKRLRRSSAMGASLSGDRLAAAL